jgi:hypothetical protein
MNQEQIIDAFTHLPPEAQRQVVDFIDFLQARYGKDVHEQKAQGIRFIDEPFIGMWKDNDQWVRNLRTTEWAGGKGLNDDH